MLHTQIKMNIQASYQFLESAAFGDLPRLASLLEKKKTGEIDLDTEVTDEDGSILQAASQKHNCDALVYEYTQMNALHFACIIGHEQMMRHLVAHTPSLLHKRCASGETPFLTLTRAIGLVRTISNQTFKDFLWSGASLDVSDQYNYNMFHHLGSHGDLSKFKAALGVFQCSKEEFLTVDFLPKDLLIIVAEYGNLYPKNVLDKLLNTKCGHRRNGFTAWQSSPLFAHGKIGKNGYS